MLIVKFVLGGKNVTWFVDESWVAVISFLITMILGITYRIRRFRNSKKRLGDSKKKMFSPRGGKFIDQCIEPDSIYELVDPVLEVMVKRMLNLPPEAGPVVISVPVLILSYILASDPIRQVTMLGVTVATDKAKSISINAGLGLVSALPIFFLPVGVVTLTTTIISLGLFVSVARGINHIDCSSIVSQVPMERSLTKKPVGFLDTPQAKSPKIFIKGDEGNQLYVPTPIADDSCSSNFKQDPVEMETSTGEKSPPISRSCEKDYVPLNERTKTLDDVKKHDSTESRDQAQPYIDRYEKRRDNYMDRYQRRRERIMNERVKNVDKNQADKGT